MTYTMTWRRKGETTWLQCKGLTLRVAAARLIGALRHTEHIEVKGIEKEK